PDSIPAADAAGERRSAGPRAFRRFADDRGATRASAVLVVIVCLCAFGPLLADHSAGDIDLDSTWLRALSHGHLLGTDDLGRDVLVRALAAGRTSLAIGLLATAITVSIGV